MSATRNRTLFLTQFSILIAIEAIFCFTPLGSLPAIGLIVATLAMVPVIITAILLGTAAGTAMGFIAGLFSFLVWTFMPPSPITAFVFTPFYSMGEMSGGVWSLVICFVPRILAGTVTGLLFSGLSRLKKGKDLLSYGASGLAGSLVNTFGVMGGIYLFFGTDYVNALAGAGALEELSGPLNLATTEGVAMAYQILLGLISTTVLFNGIPEAIVGALAAYFICRPIKKYILHKNLA